MEVTIDIHLLIKQLYGMQIEDANTNLLKAYTLLPDKSAACELLEAAHKSFKRAQVILNRFRERFSDTDVFILNNLSRKCGEIIKRLNNDITLGG